MSQPRTRAGPGCGYTGKLLFRQRYCSKRSSPRAASDGSGGRTDTQLATVPTHPCNSLTPTPSLLPGAASGVCCPGQTGSHPAHVALPAPGSCPPARGPSLQWGQSHRPRYMRPSHEPHELGHRGGGLSLTPAFIGAARVLLQENERMFLQLPTDKTAVETREGLCFSSARETSSLTSKPHGHRGPALSLAQKCCDAQGSLHLGDGRAGLQSSLQHQPRSPASILMKAAGLRRHRKRRGLQPTPRARTFPTTWPPSVFCHGQHWCSGRPDNAPGTLSTLLLFSVFS